jgi:hypothetical protein
MIMTAPDQPWMKKCRRAEALVDASILRLVCFLAAVTLRARAYGTAPGAVGVPDVLSSTAACHEPFHHSS